jgi:hypothetical protein
MKDVFKEIWTATFVNRIGMHWTVPQASAEADEAVKAAKNRFPTHVNRAGVRIDDIVVWLGRFPNETECILYKNGTGQIIMGDSQLRAWDSVDELGQHICTDCHDGVEIERFLKWLGTFNDVGHAVILKNGCGAVVDTLSRELYQWYSISDLKRTIEND